MKATLTQLKEAYERMGNVWKVAEEFGMCGQAVWERLKRNGLLHPVRRFTKEEDQIIRETYAKGFTSGDGTINELVIVLKRDRHCICRYARKKGMTIPTRKSHSSLKNTFSKIKKDWHDENEHPRGMLGKTHSEEYSRECGRRAAQWYLTATEYQKYTRNVKMLKTKLAKYGTIAPQLVNIKTSWKQGWREIGGKRKYFRSRWEANYARYLEFLKQNGEIKDWFHEPETFWFPSIERGAVSYLPDFKILNNDESHYWVEVKGYMCPRSKTKIKRFKKYFRQERLELVEAPWFKNNAPRLRGFIQGWEV